MQEPMEMHRQDPIAAALGAVVDAGKLAGAAALMLFDQGRYSLDDPITRWAPEFAQMRVLRSPPGPLDQTVPAQCPIIFEDLPTHRAGITYEAVHPGPIAQAFAAALGGWQGPPRPTSGTAHAGCSPMTGRTPAFPSTPSAWRCYPVCWRASSRCARRKTCSAIDP
jgi:hypothetical protein